MAKITIKVPRDLDWTPEDSVRLHVGTENSADLAGSTPSGGRVVDDAAPWILEERGGLGMDGLGEGELGESESGWGLGEGELGFGDLGVDETPRLVLEHTHVAADKCADLPVGITVADALRNVSTVIEQIAEIADPPRGARGLEAAGTDVPGEVELSWTESPDV